jgi:hypothetical protein
MKSLYFANIFALALMGAACTETTEDPATSAEDELRKKKELPHSPCPDAQGSPSDATSQQDAAPSSPTQSEDPFDPNSCTGPLLTNMASRFAPGAARASLGRYTLRYRERVCTSVTGCGAWSSSTAVKDVHQKGLYRLITWGHATDNGYVTGEGRAELAVFQGAIVLELTDDGARSEDSRVRHFLQGSAVSRSYPYGTTRYPGDFAYGATSVLATAGGKPDGSWLPEHQEFELRGDIRSSCTRLVATPSPEVRYDSYREVEVAALLRY